MVYGRDDMHDLRLSAIIGRV